MAAYNHSPQIQDMLDELQDGESDATLRNERFSPYVTINTKPTQERSRSHDRGSLLTASSRASRPLLARNNILVGSSHDEDLVSELIRLKFTIQLLDSKDHQPIINERGHSARDKTKPKSGPS
jgi:hypothetical protein